MKQMMMKKRAVCFNVVLSLSVTLQSSWVISVELAIGPEEGISYLTDKGSTVSNGNLSHKVELHIGLQWNFRCSRDDDVSIFELQRTSRRAEHQLIILPSAGLTSLTDKDIKKTCDPQVVRLGALHISNCTVK